MTHSIQRIGLIGAIIAGGAFSVQAQEAGSLLVSVKDGSGKAVSGARVIIKSPTQIGGAKVLVTEADGRARFQNLYPGVFEVNVNHDGFVAANLKNIRVQLSQVSPVNVTLGKQGSETVEVIAAAQSVDTTTATTSTYMKLSTVENLPTGRTYTDYLKLAPGVVANPGSGVDFALAGSLSRNNSGDQGARNNTYVLDGVDSTDPQSGRALARFNSEIIQEQEIKTGGITAEVSARGGGAVSNVVTKSGGNDFTGSLNYYMQNSSLYGSRKAEPQEKQGKLANFSSYDTAFTFGGPILKDRWWFFTSMQKQNTKRDGEFASTASPVVVKKDASQDDMLSFLKTTFQIAQDHKVEASYTLNKSKDVSLAAATTVPSQDFDRERTQKIYNLKYEGFYDSWTFTGKVFGFNNDSTPKPKTAAGQVTIVYPNTTYGSVPGSSGVASYLKNAGGLGAYNITELGRDGFSFDVSKLVQGWAGDHMFKFGAMWQTEKRTASLQNSGPDGADYENLMIGDRPVTLSHLFGYEDDGNYSSASWGSDPEYALPKLKEFYASDARLRAYVDTLPGADLEHKLLSIPFNTADPRNSAWGAYQYRIRILKSMASTTKRKAQDFYIQDTWNLPGNLFTAYLGMRFNKDSYYASTGDKLHTTELNKAPRLGVTYNHKGEGRLKLYATWGRYFEPIKLDMVNFAGTLGTEQAEEMYIGGSYANWLPLRLRGGSTVFDCLMAPTLQSPYTDETRLGLQHDLGAGWQWEMVYTHREDKRLVEDFSLSLYTTPDHGIKPSAARLGYIKSVYGGTDQEWTDRYLKLMYPLSHFGLSSIPENYNYVLANLIGGKREFDTFDVSLRYSDANWQFMANATYMKAMGNSLSAGEADYQGDTAHLDPRLPWMWGYLPGSQDLAFKTYFSYTFTEGLFKDLTLGGTYVALTPPRWTLGNNTYGRSLQGPYFEGFDREPATRFGHAYNQLDLRVKYAFTLAGKYKGEAFLDIFNVPDRQGALTLEETKQGASGYRTGDSLTFQAPRRYYLGVRFGF